MRKWDKSRQGIAAVEFAMLLPVVVLLLFFLIEGAQAMHAYSNLVEASREGARLVLMDGEEANVGAMVQALTEELDATAVSTTVNTSPETVTVEVYYDYQPFNENIFKMLTGDTGVQLAASTTMPLP